MRIFHTALIVFVLFWIGTILFRPLWERPKTYDIITLYKPTCGPLQQGSQSSGQQGDQAHQQVWGQNLCHAKRNKNERGWYRS